MDPQFKCPSDIPISYCQLEEGKEMFYVTMHSTRMNV